MLHKADKGGKGWKGRIAGGDQNGKKEEMLQLRGEQHEEIRLISQCVAQMSNNDYLS